MVLASPRSPRLVVFTAAFSLSEAGTLAVSGMVHSLFLLLPLLVEEGADEGTLSSSTALALSSSIVRPAKPDPVPRVARAGLIVLPLSSKVRARAGGRKAEVSSSRVWVAM